MRDAPVSRRKQLATFYGALLKCYRDLHFTLLEINPLVVDNDSVTPLDLAAKIDETAHFLCQSKWGAYDLPAPFGRPEFPRRLTSDHWMRRPGFIKTNNLERHWSSVDLAAAAGLQLPMPYDL